MNHVITGLTDPEHVFWLVVGVGLGVVLYFLIETYVVPAYASYILRHELLPDPCKDNEGAHDHRRR